MKRHLLRPWVLIGPAALIGISGCFLSLIPASSVEVPATLQYVLDNVATFRTYDSAPDPGSAAAVTDAADLDGCWGAALVDSDGFPTVALFLAYRFNSADGTYLGWSGLGGESGELAPLAPMVTEESGGFALEAGGVIRTTIQQIRANLNPTTGQVTAALQVQPTTEAVERTLQARWTGDALTLLYESDDASHPGAEGSRVVFQPLTCPSGE